MEAGASYGEALAEAQRLGYAEADPTDDVTGADAAAKMAILATVAFGSRVKLYDVDATGIEEITPALHAAARGLDMVAPPRRHERPSSTGSSTFASIPPSSTGTTRWPRSRARSTR